MSHRLQVLVDESEFEAFRQAAARAGISVSEWARRALRSAQRQLPGNDQARKLAAVRSAARHSFPTSDIDQMNAEIEQGYQR